MYQAGLLSGKMAAQASAENAVEAPPASPILTEDARRQVISKTYHAILSAIDDETMPGATIQALIAECRTKAGQAAVIQLAQSLELHFQMVGPSSLVASFRRYSET